MDPERNDSGSEDEEPEAISQSVAKSAAFEKLKHEKVSILNQKNAAKEKRRKRQRQLDVQKESRKEGLLEKLPEEVINILANVDDEKGEPNSGSKDIPVDVREGSTNRQKHLVGKVEKEKSLKVKKAKKKQDADSSNDENDSITSEENMAMYDEDRPVCEVRSLKQTITAKSKAAAGREFLREQLYGKRIKRIDSSSLKNSSALKFARPKARF